MRFKILVLALTAMFNFGCAKDGGGNGSSEDVSCRTQRQTHTGCCSGHGGFGASCGNNEARYTTSGKLVCNDSSISPSCTY